MKTVNEDLLRMYGNPNSIQFKVLKGLERDIGGGHVISSPNNVASHLTEAYSATTAGMIQDISEELLRRYPKQAQNTDELFKHMSDFDYVGWYSSPSSTHIEIVFMMETLIKQAVVDQSKNYDTVTIPRYSEFKIGNQIFSTYTPIEIRLRGTNSTESSVSVVYSETYNSPLHNIENNVLEHQVANNSGLDILSIRIPVYQFKRTVTKTEIFTNAPFKKTIKFANRFYAIRVYTDIDNGYGAGAVMYSHGSANPVESFKDSYGKNWYEVGQTLESDIYDTNHTVVPAVVVMPDIDNGLVTITIPQIFLTNKQFGDNLHIELFSTTGELEMVVDTAATIAGVFPFEEDESVNKPIRAFFDTENVRIYPLDALVSGGSNGISFEDLRNRIVYNTSGNTSINSPDELENYLKEQDYTITRFKDGITNRIYLCNKELVIDNTNLPSGLLRTKLNIDLDSELPPGVIAHQDGSLTLTPEVLYQYDPIAGVCTPLDATHPLSTEGISAKDMVKLYDDNTFTYSPFHIQLDNLFGTALATTYDFSGPHISWITAKQDSDTAKVVSMYGAEIDHVSADNKFVIRMYVDEMDAEASNMRMRLRLPTKPGQFIEMTSDVLSTSGSEYYFEFELVTTYHVTAGKVLISTPLSDGYVVLESDSTTRSECLLTQQYADSRPDVFAEYTFNLKLGEPLHLVFNTVEVSTTSLEPLTYNADVFARYPNNMYERYTTTDLAASPPQYAGDIICTIVNNSPAPNTVEFQLEHAEGDIMRSHLLSVEINDENKEMYYGATSVDFGVSLEEDTLDVWGIPGIFTIDLPIRLNRAGDPVLDNQGKPQYSARSVLYYVNMIHINNKSKYQQRNKVLQTVGILPAIRDLIRNNCNVVSTFSNRLLQNTEAYYQPKRSIGTALCRADTPYKEMYDLEIGISLRLHVLRRVMIDTEARASIRLSIIEMIDEMLLGGYCSLTELSKKILSELSGLVTSVDILGINDNMSVQTLTPVDKEINLSLSHQLVVGAGGIIKTKRALDLEFISSAQDTAVVQ